MYTVIETPVYSNKVGGNLAEDERDAFAAFIASNMLRTIKEAFHHGREEKNEP